MLISDALAMVGCEATDRLSGAEGVIESIAFKASGSVHAYLMLPRLDGRWLDAEFMSVGKRVVPAIWTKEVTAPAGTIPFKREEVK